MKRRDAKRIDPLIDLLRECWKAHPEQRLGQLVYNLAGLDDFFYLEDDVLLERLKENLDEQLRGHDGQD